VILIFPSDTPAEGAATPERRAFHLMAFLSWAFHADVTQDLSTNTWSLKTSSSSNGTFQAGPTYPTWSTVAKNGNMNGCP